MGIAFASHGMLWPRADIIREQVQVIEVLVEEDITLLVAPEVDTEQEILATAEECVEIVVADEAYYVTVEDPEVIEVTVTVADSC
jgi:hypothetical protein